MKSKGKSILFLFCHWNHHRSQGGHAHTIRFLLSLHSGSVFSRGGRSCSFLIETPLSGYLVPIGFSLLPGHNQTWKCNSSVLTQYIQSPRRDGLHIILTDATVIKQVTDTNSYTARQLRININLFRHSNTFIMHSISTELFCEQFSFSSFVWLRL